MKKLFTLFTVIAALALSAASASAIAGSGTEDAPFIITNQDELEIITDFPSKHFRLANDIELDGIWTPICKETSSGYFEGVFDGDGHTISDLITDGTEGGLFKHNKGTIKNLNIVLSADGFSGSGAVANNNTGTISNCTVTGDISANFSYVGGICAHNTKNITQCAFTGNIENAGDYAGGISGYSEYTTTNITQCAVKGSIKAKSYAGGISGYNKRYITESYFIGSLVANRCGGITAHLDYTVSGSNRYGYTYYNGTITDCYAVAKFDGENTYSCGISNSGAYSIIENSFYDKKVSGLTDTATGTPKSTAAMKMTTIYTDAKWDFENIWGMDASINDGYPYLRWEKPNVTEMSDYTINEIKIKSADGTELESIPDEDSFLAEISVTKNSDRAQADSLIIAIYDENDVLVDIKLMSGTYYKNQTVNFSAMISADKKIGKIKSFVWDSLKGMVPLSNEEEV